MAKSRELGGPKLHVLQGGGEGATMRQNVRGWVKFMDWLGASGTRRTSTGNTLRLVESGPNALDHPYALEALGSIAVGIAEKNETS